MTMLVFWLEMKIVVMVVIMMMMLQMMITCTCVIIATHRYRYWIHAVGACSNNRMNVIARVIHNSCGGMLLMMILGSIMGLMAII